MNAVQRSVTKLLNALAPEKVLKRAKNIAGPVAPHRTPNGCVLQSEHAAVSVSWFSNDGRNASLGELHVTVWRGTVTRPGTAPSRKGSTISAELVFLPLDPPEGDSLWISPDGTRYDTTSLADKCMALLSAEMDAAERRTP
jgi:hypothetical protein